MEIREPTQLNVSSEKHPVVRQKIWVNAVNAMAFFNFLVQEENVGVQYSLQNPL